MATSIFSPARFTSSLFSWRKKPEEQMASFPSQPMQSTYKPPMSVPTNRTTAAPRSTSTFPRTMPNTSMMSVPGQTNPALQRIQQARQQNQPQTTPPPTDLTGINPLVAKAREISQRQAGFYADQADKRVGQLEEQQGIRTKYADERVSKLEALRDSAIGRINETIPLQEQATNEYKTQVEDQYGRQMKEQAQAQREEQQGIQDLFAGLNTMDSGAFQTQSMKSRERLTANQSATIQARTNELNAADRDLKSFKLEAQQQIANEVAKFDDLLLQIAENMEVGSAEYNAAVQQVYDQAQEAILGLEAGLNEREMAYEEKAQALQQEMMMEQMKSGGGTELKDKQAMSLSANNALDDIMMTINGNEGIYRNLNPLDQSKRDYDAKVSNAIDLIIRTRTGAAATEAEVKAMKGMFPTIWDSKETAMSKLSRLKSGLQSSLLGTPYASNQSQMAGGQVVTAPDGQQIILVD